MARSATYSLPDLATEVKRATASLKVNVPREKNKFIFRDPEIIFISSFYDYMNSLIDVILPFDRFHFTYKPFIQISL